MHAGPTLPPEVCDPQRTFSEDQRRLLQRNADGRCERCAEPVGGSYHAHHMVPWSAGGATTIRNGKCVCSPCHSKEHRALNRRGLDGVFSAKQIGELRYWKANQYAEGLLNSPPLPLSGPRVNITRDDVFGAIDPDAGCLKVLAGMAAFAVLVLLLSIASKWFVVAAAATAMSIIGVKLTRAMAGSPMAQVVVPAVVGGAVVVMLFLMALA